MTKPTSQDGVGPLLREWRRRRKLSQQELALRTEISARHLSFIETGRSQPSRALVHRLADSLEVPLRQRNTLLVAAGYSPLYQETPLDAPRLKVVRQAVDRLLTAHAPYPALAVDASENIVAMNRGAEVLLSEVSPALLVPPVNVMRVCLHPDGLARQVINVDEWRSHLLGRLYRQSRYSGREELRELYEEVSAYGPRPVEKDCSELSDTIVASIRVRALGTELRLFSTVTTFGAATDITVSELSLETMHPANERTAAAFRAAVSPQADRKDMMSLLSRSA
ncbi:MULTISPECIES: helix-turn-helix domain-containing protein [unclassified Streptomyces]|uniref:helix-turn-helix domain-containing protein n=1 Tax=unclassified Streptomyces TaxID=2593676 RepID=UPI0037F45AA3